MMLRQALDGGHGFTDDALRGVSLWEPPGRTTPFLSQLWALCRMVYMFRSNLARALRVQSHVDRCRPRRPHWYLAYIATDPAHQRSGIGSELLRPMLEAADRERTPVYLECSNSENIPFYRAHGFHLVDSISLPDGPGVWPMLREVR
jgi:ribosomal protein S18 acetylase RimI-like enzyme